MQTLDKRHSRMPGVRETRDKPQSVVSSVLYVLALCRTMHAIIRVARTRCCIQAEYARRLLSWLQPWRYATDMADAASRAALLMLSWRCTAGFVLCPAEQLAFFHVPKCGGSLMKSLLKAAELDCLFYGGILSAQEAAEGYGIQFEGHENSKAMTALKFDPMHLTPIELDEHAHRGLLKLTHRAANNLTLAQRYGAGEVNTGASQAAVTVDELLTTWTGMAVVRNPYMRVLAAFEQRNGPFYDKATVWGKDHPTEFAPFMRWLRSELHERRLAWCCSPTITHFRPASRYTHWPDGTRALELVAKQEDMPGAVDAMLQQGLRLKANAPAAAHAEALLRNSSAAYAKGERQEPEAGRVSGGTQARQRHALCRGVRGCEQHERDALLNTTAHTLETLRIVNQLYRRDFEWLNYTMLTLRDDGSAAAMETVRNRTKQPVPRPQAQRALSPLDWGALCVVCVCVCVIRARG